MVRHILRHDTVRADGHIIAHVDSADDLSTGPDVHAPADHRRAFAPSSIRLPDRHALTDVAILSDHSALIDDDVTDMTDVQAATDGRRVWNRAAELVFVARKHPYPDTVDRPVDKPGPAPFEIPAQAEIEHVLDAVA